jgi:hypothetical protein
VRKTGPKRRYSKSYDEKRPASIKEHHEKAMSLRNGTGGRKLHDYEQHMEVFSWISDSMIDFELVMPA